MVNSLLYNYSSFYFQDPLLIKNSVLKLLISIKRLLLDILRAIKFLIIYSIKKMSIMDIDTK